MFSLSLDIPFPAKFHFVSPGSRHRRFQLGKSFAFDYNQRLKKFSVSLPTIWSLLSSNTVSTVSALIRSLFNCCCVVFDIHLIVTDACWAPRCLISVLSSWCAAFFFLLLFPLAAMRPILMFLFNCLVRLPTLEHWLKQQIGCDNFVPISSI